MMKVEMKHTILIAGLAAVCTGLALSCGSPSGQNTGESAAVSAAETSETDTSQWVALFDGASLSGWHGFNKTEPVDNWTIIDSALVCLGAAEWDTGGDIVSDREYENFELEWDWKIEKDGNSGIMYRVKESPEYEAPWETGPEYQLFDDSKDGRDQDGVSDSVATLQTGADYAMHAPTKRIKTMPLGEWNNSKLVVNNGHVEHWLNGDKVVEFQIGSDDWNKRKAEGKWRDYPDYGMAPKGHIALQDHGRKAYFKNMKIREL